MSEHATPAPAAAGSPPAGTGPETVHRSEQIATPSIPASVDAGQFLKAILPAPEGEERIRVLALRPGGPPQERFARTIGEALAFAARHQDDADVYFAVTLKQGPQGDAAHTARFGALWADVDAKCFGGSKAAAWAALQRLPLPPSIVVHSGHGLHAYWLLHEPLTAADAPRARAVMRGLYRLLSERAEAPLDDVSDMARLLRVPGTCNRKAHPPKRVTVVRWEPERRYALADFAPLGIGTDPRDQPPGVDGQRPLADPGGIPQGTRNVRLTRLAGWLRREGLSAPAIEAALLAVNAAACTPPLPATEVGHIARSVGRYPPGRGGLDSFLAPLGGERARNEFPSGREPLDSFLAPIERAPARIESDRWTPRPLSALAADGGAVDWLWEGYIGRGLITELYGFWKSGKTTLLGALAARMGAAPTPGGPAELAGGRVVPGRVLVVSEEAPGTWALRRDDLSLSDHVHVICRPFAKRATWEEWEAFVAHVTALVASRGYVVVVFDALPHLWPVWDENDAAQVLRALAPLHAVADAGAGVLIVHHPRKSGGGEATAGRGSGALAAFVDVIVEFRRYDPSRPDDRRRTLSVYSRLGEPTEVVIEWQGGAAYVTHGDRAAVERQGRRGTLTALLRLLPGATVDELHQQWGAAADGPVPSRRTVAADLEAAVRAGWVQRTGSGHRGDPFRYWLASPSVPSNGLVEHPPDSILAGPVSIGARNEFPPPGDRPPPA